MPLAIALAVVYLLWAPSSADLAAQTFRADLFSEHGLQTWSNAWYQGFHLPGYSLLYPALGSWLGPRLVGALALVAATVAFSMLIRPYFGERAVRWATALFALGAACNLYSGRITFVLGTAVATTAVLALERRRRGLAFVLAGLTSAASPVAGLFLALIGATHWLRHRKLDGLILAGPAVAVVGALSLLFPTTGTEPFELSSFIGVPLACVALFVLAPAHMRWLRAGLVLYLALGALFGLASSPVGGNAVRLAMLLGPALAALVVLESKRTPIWALVIIPFLYWPLQAAVRDVANASGEPSVERSYYAPLLEQLENQSTAGPFRVEVPPTRERWEAVYVAESHPLARGWLRQLESDDFDLFQHGHLDAASYRRWLDDRAVAFVAVPDAAADYLARDERRLIAGGLPYLSEVWSDPHWKLYMVRRPQPLVDRPAEVRSAGADWFKLRAPRAGSYDVRFAPSRWWRVVTGAGCVDGEAPGSGGTAIRVRLDAPGQVTVRNELSAAGLFGGSGRC